MGLAASAPHADVARELAAIAAASDDPFLRRYAAYSTSFMKDAEGGDVVVPALLRRLKYERDREAFVWIAASLAAFENYAGLQALFDLTYGPEGDAAADQARAQVGPIVAASGMHDAVALRDAWDAGEIGRTEGASEGLLVADLSGEHFQLRGVDDARHTLSRLGPWAAAELALALEDDDAYVRLHVAQSLERMGRRGRRAKDGLASALVDPSDAVAGAAAEALAAVAGDDAIAPVLERLDADPPHELRVALVRALGHVPTPPVDRLAAAFDAAGRITDLRLAAADGLVRAGEADRVLPWLADAMEDRFGDPAGAEALVQVWLESPAEAEGEHPRADLRDAWDALAPPAAVIHTGEQARDRRSQRAALVRDFLAR
jgi:HEAT repeat protein